MTARACSYVTRNAVEAHICALGKRRASVDANVHVEIEMRNNKVAIQVSNAAIDLKPEDIIYMKDRFWRKHKARVTSGHSGLGLALVEALARIMGLKVNLALDEKRVFLVTISGLSAA